MLCKNLVTPKAHIHGASSSLVCDFMKRADLLFASNEEIRGAVDRLDLYKAACTKKDFELRQQAIGFTYQENGVLQDKDLRDIVKPAEQYVHDWQHGIFNNGMFNVLAYFFFNTVSTAAKALAIWNEFGEYLNAWRFPKALHFDPRKAQLFSDVRIKFHKSAETVKMGASEGRCILPILALFADRVGRRLGYQFAADALCALCDLVDALAASALGVVSPAEMRKTVAAMAIAIEGAGWKSELIPKFHWAIHYPDELERFGVNLSCWVHERKHKLVKRYGQDQSNMTAYSKAVLTESVAHQLHDMVGLHSVANLARSGWSASSF